VSLLRGGIKPAGPSSGSDRAEAGPGAGAWGARAVLVWLAPAAVLLPLLALGLRLIDVGASDFSVVGLFSTDEQLAGQLVRAMVQHGNLGLSNFYSYGPLDLYAARFLLLPWSLLHGISDEAIIVVLRAVSLLAGLGCVAATYALGAHLWDRTTGLVAASFMALNPVVLSWSTTAHPDMLQLLWLLLGLECAAAFAAQHSRVFLVLGAVCAGLAFATKYSGELLLPVLWLADGLCLGTATAAHRAEAFRGRLAGFTADVALTLALFVATFLLVDPSVVASPREFLYQALLEAGLAHSGHVFRLGSSTSWIATLARPSALGPAAAALAAAGLLAWGIADLRRIAPTAQKDATAAAAAARAGGRILVAAWAVGYLLLLLVWIADQQVRYALPLLPAAALFAAAPLVWLSRRSRLTGALAGLLFLAAIVPPAWTALQYERAMAGRMNDPLVQDRLAAGRWLAARVAPGTPIVTDAYAYLPPSLTNVDVTFGLTPAQLAADHPRVIVTDRSIRDRFRDPSAAARYVDGAATYQQIAATYDALDAGRLACYPLLQRFGPESIYGRLPGDPAPAGCSRGPAERSPAEPRGAGHDPAVLETIDRNVGNAGLGW
jgi:4-amino-4-deoxy-L-arabinose transferase-like glycosyltransferase